MKKLFSILCTAVLVLSFSSCQKQETSPKYVFMIIGDGMSINGIAAAENYLAWRDSLNYKGPRLTMRQLPVMGMVDTYSANSVVTCSSAAATAMACGQKTKNSYAGVDADKNPMPNIAEYLHGKGYNIGIVTNEPLNHATPACYYGHDRSRSHYGNLSKQLAESGFEVFAGNGFISDKHKEYEGFDPVANARDHGYTVCYGPAELAACPEGEKVCLFQPSSRTKESKITEEADKNKTYDIEEAEEGDMTVQEMLELTIERLGDRKPFFIMCEGGDIDHAAHANFLMSEINEIFELDKAVESALAFYRKHSDETLIIVTSDHETGAICVGGPASDRRVDWKTLEDDWNANKSRGNGEAQFCKELSESANVGWYTTHHNGGNVPVFAIGVNSQNFANAMDNTEFIAKMGFNMAQ